MTQANLEMLRALETAGVPREEAQAAATSVAAAADVATKADLAQLEVARAAMETRLTRQHYSGLAVLLAAIAIATTVG